MAKIGLVPAAAMLKVSRDKLKRLVAEKLVPAEIVEFTEERYVFDTDELARIDIEAFPDYRERREVSDE